ncbi:M20/M25/M40 family metallo-hydrolase [Hymenobacter sp. BT175]|uniref:M20/M25/M40 family metallo-hydrolase n=1 Tax=Hymenobacter translucens TaxID=2886507 RepID=UPI001D0EF8D5|nr:M20/M25/M40 family metallo-hydrolase [Hymenobacter translucens]MCC2545283.1 M20/M25/M40 family metallo-hydrolase [Hymenobacter translucens]
MKKIIFICLSVYLSSSAIAQKKNAKPAVPQVSAATVERVARTLAADDMQGRASTQAGGQKAAQFLAAEFQQLGLQPLPGQGSFEQVFPLYQSTPAALYVTINGRTIPKGEALLVSSQPHLNWTSEDDPRPRVVVIEAGANYDREIRSLLRPSENTMVLVDPAHAAAFKRTAAYLAKGGPWRAEKVQPFSTVLVQMAGPMANAKFRVAANAATKATEIRNVVGVLPGKDPTRAAEQVIFSAHYDHIGILPPVAGDSIANGADDDASGTAAVVALAEYFGKRKDNQRTLIFVAFTAEEMGGFGSRHFATQINPAQVVAMFNIEMIGKMSKFGPNTAFITGYEKSDFGKILQAGVQGSPFRFEPDPYPAQNLFLRSDNATLARYGVPAHSISTDQIPTDKLYHSVKDEISSLDFPNMTAVVAGVARGAAGIVAGTQTPSRLVLEAAVTPRP